MESELKTPLFSVGQEVATFLVSCGLLPQVWEESIRASNAESFTLNEYEDVAYVTFPSFRRIEDYIASESRCGEGNIQTDLKGNDDKPAFISPGALTLFLHILDKTDFQAKLQVYTDSKQRRLKPIIFVGHSLGGAVATLATLWVLGKRLRQSSPFCITFGCPLVGDKRLVEAIGRENWGGNFCHVVSKQDIVPRMLLAPFESIAAPFATIFPCLQGTNVHDALIQDACNTLLNQVLASTSNTYSPFGTYMFCSRDGAACIENSKAVLQMLRFTMESQEFSQASLLEHTRYGSILEKVIQNSITERRMVNSISEYSYEMGISLQLGAIGIGAQHGTARIVLQEAGEKENEHNTNIDMLAVELSLKQSNMAELEWYKECCERMDGSGNGGFGYYDAFKSQNYRRDVHADLCRVKLEEFWNDIIEKWRGHKLPSDFQSQNKWINAGTAYRRLVEPLDIAHYYRTSHADSSYLSAGRPDRYKALQKWMEDKEKTRSARGQIPRTKRASLTADSCFWAHAEEARKDLEYLKQGQIQRLQNLQKFEEYVTTMENSNSISSDVILEGNSFKMWWEEWKEYKNQTFILEM